MILLSQSFSRFSALNKTEQFLHMSQDKSTPGNKFCLLKQFDVKENAEM